MNRSVNNKTSHKMGPKKISKKKDSDESEEEYVDTDVSSVDDIIINDNEDEYENEEVVDDDIDEYEQTEDNEEYTETNNLNETEFLEGANKEEDCYYQYAQNDNLLEEELNMKISQQNAKRVPDSERMTTNKLTKYEFVRLLGDRAKQISLNAKVMVKNVKNLSPEEIAIEELRHGVMPLKLRRYLPDGNFEEWKLSELKVDL